MTRNRHLDNPLDGYPQEVPMPSHPPPVPPANRSDKGPGEPAKSDADRPDPKSRGVPDPKQGQQGTIRENTTNTGYQQDR